MIQEPPGDHGTSATDDLITTPAVDLLNHTTLIKTEPKPQIKTTQKPEENETSNPYGSVTIVLFKRWEFLVALLCFEVFAYCATLFIIFGMQNKRARGKRFGTFSWKGRKGNDRAKTIIA